jgi:hypothetical protein
MAGTRRSRVVPVAVVASTAAVVSLVGVATRSVVAEVTPIGPAGSVCPGAIGSPGDVAVMNLTPVSATAAGFGALRSSGAPSNNSLGEHAVSNVNFRVGSVDPNVALAAIGPDGRVCFDNSQHSMLHLVGDQMGVLPASVYEPAAATGAARIVDTRRGFVAGGPLVGAVGPGASVCPQAVGAPGRVAVLNITPVLASRDGFAAVRASDAPSNNSLGDAAVSNVNFTVGSVDPNLAFGKIGTDGRICIDNSQHATVHLVVDQMGTIRGDAFAPAAASGATRLIDTRRMMVVGGTASGALAPGAVVCAAAVGRPGDVAVLNGTPVAATGPGFMAVRSSGAPSNNSLGESAVSNWNFGIGTVDPNVAFAEIGPDGRICVDNSPHATVEVVLDQAGYILAGQFTPASTTGAARIVDTRRGLVASPMSLPTPTTTTSTTLPVSGVAVPGTPRELSATPGPGSIALAWRPPSSGGAVVEYLVERAEQSTGPWTLAKVTSATSLVDTHLSPSVDHWYRVRALNSAGWGSPTSPVVGRAANAVRPGPVRQLSASSDDTSVTLSWQPPAADGGAPVTHYNVSPLRSCTLSEGNKSVAGTTYRHSGLTSGTRYCYSVEAINSVGGGTSTRIEVNVGRPTTPAPCPVTASWFPEQDGSIEWSLEVTWNTPGDSGSSPISSYAVTWFDWATSATIRTDFYPTSSRTAWLDQVNPAKGYQVGVTPFNASGAGVRCLSGRVQPQP